MYDCCRYRAIAKRQSTMQMFFKKADRASATDCAVAEKIFLTSEGISTSGEDVLEDAIPAIQSDENMMNSKLICVKLLPTVKGVNFLLNKN